MGSPLCQEVHAVPSLPPPQKNANSYMEEMNNLGQLMLAAAYSFQWIITMISAVVWCYAIAGIGTILKAQEFDNLHLSGAKCAGRK
jgi:hypothetical protein